MNSDKRGFTECTLNNKQLATMQRGKIFVGKKDLQFLVESLALHK